MPTDGENEPRDGSNDADGQSPSDDEVVDAAASAAESVVLSRIDTSTLEDVDVTVTFENGVLDVDVYVHAPDSRHDEAKVAEDAALAARSAVDDLF